MNERTREQDEALFGEAALNSEYAPGDVIHYRNGDTVVVGTVIFTRATAPVGDGDRMLKRCHIVDTGKGWPKVVYPRDVVQPE